jgi:hypothetical protein
VNPEIGEPLLKPREMAAPPFEPALIRETMRRLVPFDDPKVFSVLFHRCDEFGLVRIFLPNPRQQPLEADVSLVFVVEINRGQNLVIAVAESSPQAAAIAQCASGGGAVLPRGFRNRRMAGATQMNVNNKSIQASL